MDAMTCCDNQQPRILEKNGRVFCASCHRYLDAASGPPQEPLRVAISEETGTNTSPQGDGDPTDQQHGIGCEYDDSLWATVDSWGQHMREAHKWTDRQVQEGE